MRLILVRHGETQENVDGIIQGWLDTKLNDNGIRQAKRASEGLNESFTEIYSSDLARCVDTAKFFRDKYLDVPYCEDFRLRERNYGDIQGEKRELHNWEAFWAIRDAIDVPNAETVNEFTDRVAEFLDYLKKTHDDDETILLVTHAGTINRILELLGLSDGQQNIKNAEPIEVTI